MARSLGREADELVAKMNLGSVAFESGDHAAAVPLWLDVLDHHRAAGTSRARGSPCSTSGSRPTVWEIPPTHVDASPKPSSSSRRSAFASTLLTRCRVSRRSRLPTSAMSKQRRCSAGQPRCSARRDPRPATSTTSSPARSRRPCACGSATRSSTPPSPARSGRVRRRARCQASLRGLSSRPEGYELDAARGARRPGRRDRT